MVRFETTLGAFTLQLDAEKAPVSVANFLSYVDEGFFDGLIFHRVIPGFMIQGGGFTPDMAQKKSDRGAIKNEAANGLANKRGTVAMARTNVVDSATSQFFINLSDNAFLDHQGQANYGYAVFGQVVEGLDTIDRIAKERTGRSKGHDDVPVTAVVINSARRVDSAS
ncbi:MAG TPA: peptidylprolyl isomerase [Steroidobacteraceae bacterium]|nr:peptidylprolyl isomerase [Steroidobacteraceae bacterium]